MEKIIGKLIHNRIIFLFLALIIAVGGCIGYYYLPKQENPDVSIPVALIVTPYPGASAEDVNELILRKLEDELSEIDHIDEIKGEAKIGLGMTIVKFDSNADNKESMQAVRNAVADAKSDLPKGALDSMVNTDLISTAGILISLSGENYSYDQLAGFAEVFQSKLSKVKGIEKFDIEGEIEKNIEVKIDIDRLNLLGLSITEINDILMMQNIEIPSGTLQKDITKINVQVSGSYEDIEDIRNTVLGVSKETGITLRLKDVASVEFKLKEDVEKYKQGADNAVIMAGYFNEGQNVVIIGKEVRKTLDEVKMSLPSDLNIQEVIYQPDDVSNSVNDFMLNLLIGVILVVIVGFFGMGYRNAIVVATAIPFSILITFATMSLFDIYIHQMSLTALIIALGILVDNAIVMSDGIQVNIDQGMDNVKASTSATSKAAIPIFAATLTTVAAISPLMGLPGAPGKFLKPISIVLIISVIASYLVAMFIIPVLGEWLFRPTKNKKTNKGIIRQWFSNVLNLGMRNKGKTIASVIVLFFLVITLLLPRLPSEFFPTIDKDFLYIEIDNDTTGNIELTEIIADDVVALLSDDQEISSYTVSIGNGLPKFFISMMPSSPDQDFAQMILKYDLDAVNEPRFENSIEFANYLQEKLDQNIVGAKTKVNLLQNGPPVDAKIVIRVSGKSYERVVEVLKTLKDKIETTEGITNLKDNVSSETLQFNVDLDSERAIMMGITNFDVQRQINMALYGTSPTIYRKDMQEYDVILKTDIESPTQLENFYIKSSFTQMKVPLKQYAEINYSTKIDTINRFNQSLSCVIFADALPGYNPTELTDEIEMMLNDIDTEGVSIDFDGERENIKENFGILGILAVMAIFLIYLILVVQFKSFIQPLVILATIPLSLIGSIIGLFLLQQPMSLTALLGIIALIGLVVKNGILLIEYINDALLAGLTVENACKDAVDKRFNAIILSAMTTIMGLFPLAISGNSLFAPMAISLMAGLLVSTVLTMVVVPVIFTCITRKKTQIPSGEDTTNLVQE